MSGKVYIICNCIYLWTNVYWYLFIILCRMILFHLEWLHSRQILSELQANKTERLDFMLSFFHSLAFGCLKITSLDSNNFFCVRQMIVGSAGQRFQLTIEKYATCTAPSIYISFRIVVAPPIVSFATFAVAIVHEIVYDQTCCCPWCFDKFHFIRYWLEKRKKEEKTHI